MHIVSQLGNDTVYALCSFSRVEGELLVMSG